MSQAEEKATSWQLLWRFAIIAVVLGMGIGPFVYFVKTRPEPKKVDRDTLGELVEVTEVQSSDELVVVSANGQVVPAQQVALIAEVGGRVTWMSDDLLPGGHFTAGQKVIRVDARDYNLMVQQQSAQVDRAQTELELEKSRKQIAEREWQLMGGGQPTEGSLAVRDPQLRTAQAALNAAKSGLNRAQLAVDKTLLKAPFNAMVHSKSVALGQLVGPAGPLATLVGTDAFWVQVSIPVDRLSWIHVPGVDGATSGAAARVLHKVGDKTVARAGKVIRLMPDLDPAGRMARVLVEIPDPLGLAGKDGSAGESPGGTTAPELPLLIGSYVTVEIDGREVSDVFRVPREALRGGDKVFLMTGDSVLDIRSVEVVWRRPDSVLISSGLKPGDKVIVSPLPSVINGMKLRTAEIRSQTAKPAGKPGAKPGDITVPGSSSGAAEETFPAQIGAQGAAKGSSQGAAKLVNPNR